MSTKNRNAMSAKKLLELHGCILTPGCFYDGLILCGAIENIEYISETGSGELKNFPKITESHLHIGKNVRNPFHKVKTEPKFYADNFIYTYQLACIAIAEQAKNLK